MSFIFGAYSKGVHAYARMLRYLPSKSPLSEGRLAIGLTTSNKFPFIYIVSVISAYSKGVHAYSGICIILHLCRSAAKHHFFARTIMYFAPFACFSASFGRKLPFFCPIDMLSCRHPDLR